MKQENLTVEKKDGITIQMASVVAGMKFNRLTVVRLHHLNDNYQKWWDCRCDCGKTAVVFQGALRCGDSQSCGCFRNENNARLLRVRKTTHGMSQTREYFTFKAMWNRCTNPKYPLFHRYGGRGISVCERWKNFENFFEDMGVKPKGASLGRINNDGNYEPSNCRWENPKQQSNNTRRSVRIAGKTVKALSGELGIKPETLYYRRKHGWSEQQMMRKKLYGTAC